MYPTPYFPRYAVAMLGALTIWIFAQWVEYHTGHMLYGNDYYGILEATYSLAAMGFATAVLGSDVWHIELDFWKGTWAEGLVKSVVGEDGVVEVREVILGVVTSVCKLPRREGWVTEGCVFFSRFLLIAVYYNIS